MKTINKELLEDLLDCKKIFKTEYRKLSSVLYFMNNSNFDTYQLEHEEEVIVNKITKRNGGRCEECQGLFLDKHLFSYVDESNEAINRNSPNLCISCYKITY